MGHRPLYCNTDQNEYTCFKDADYLRSIIEPALNFYKVDVTITGHVHNYERTLPLVYTLFFYHFTLV